MANTATPRTPITGFGGTRFNGKVTPYTITYDTPNTDLTLKTPTESNRIALVGLTLLNDSAHDLTLKSASTTLQTYKFSANSGPAFPFTPENPALYHISEPGEALKLSNSTSLPLFTAYLLEF